MSPQKSCLELMRDDEREKTRFASLHKLILDAPAWRFSWEELREIEKTQRPPVIERKDDALAPWHKSRQSAGLPELGKRR